MSLSPRRPKGPHLNALRAFEAAARLQSFAAAADELSVTPGAITQHIKSLEEWAGAKLFIRSARGITLTPLAEQLLPEFSLAFDQLGMAVQELRTLALPKKVRVAALPAVAQLWLAPRLGQLRKVAPDLSISVVALETPPNLAREPFDLTLFFSDGSIGPNEIVISEDIIFPVCAPSVADRLTSVSDLSRETLLHDGSWTDDWGNWLKTQPGGETVNQSGTAHSLYSVALEEARHGGGVLMAHEVLVQAYLDNGSLVRPFPGSLTLSRKLIAGVTSTFKRSPAFQVVESLLRNNL